MKGNIRMKGFISKNNLILMGFILFSLILLSSIKVCANTSNSMPIASNVYMQGRYCVGGTLTGKYTYSDADGDQEGASTFQWYRSDSPGVNKIAIPNATQITYTLAPEDDGKWITFAVTPVAATGTIQGVKTESNNYLRFSPTGNVIEIWEDSFAKVKICVSYHGDKAGRTITMMATSSNEELIPNSNIQITGGSGVYFITMTPILNKNGTSAITLKLSDGVLETEKTLILNVKPFNDEPIISDIPDQTTNEDVPIDVNFTVDDVDNDISGLIVTVVPYGNPDLVKTIVKGNGKSRTITTTPAEGQSGTATVKVSVSDGKAVVSKYFKVNVIPVNDPPQISEIKDLSTSDDTPIDNINFRIIDPDSSTIVVTATSSNKELVPDANIILSGERYKTMKIVPEKDRAGQTTIEIKVSDGEYEAKRTFNVTVVPNPPQLISGYPQIGSLSYNGGEIKIKVDEDGKAYYVVLQKGKDAPSAQEIKSGTGKNGELAIKNGSINLIKNSEGIISLIGLEESTEYDVYVVVEDGIPDIMSTIKSLSLKTIPIPLEKIEITTLPTKTKYKVGEPLDITGMVVTGIYSDGSKKIIKVTADNITGFDNTLATFVELTVTVEGKQAYYVISVTKYYGPDLEGVSMDDDTNTITGLTDKMEFSTDRIKWIAYNAKSPNLPDITGIVTLYVRVAGTQTHYPGDDERFDFTVANSIEITTLPTKLLYKVGDELDISGIVVKGKHSDGNIRTEKITTANITGFDSSAVAISQILTITVDGKTAVFAISIIKADGPELVGVSINDDTNTITGMTAGMEFSTDGINWIAYNSGTPNLPDLTGTVTLHVRVAATATHNPGAEKIFKFKVLNRIEITTLATKLIYMVGDRLDISGMVVTGIYSDGSTKTETITTANITGFDSSKETSNQILTVIVNGKTATFIIVIKGPLPPKDTEVPPSTPTVPAGVPPTTPIDIVVTVPGVPNNPTQPTTPPATQQEQTPPEQQRVDTITAKANICEVLSTIVPNNVIQNIPEAVKDQIVTQTQQAIVTSLQDMRVTPIETPLNSATGAARIEIGDDLTSLVNEIQDIVNRNTNTTPTPNNNAISENYALRMNIVETDTNNQVYEKKNINRGDTEMTVENLEDYTWYTVRFEIILNGQVIGVREKKILTPDRTAPVINSVFVRRRNSN